MQSNAVGLDGQIPVFIFPNSISFYVDDHKTHKQVLTLYNPYEFPIKFQILCTAPKKYSVVDASGSVASKCCVDLVVRHKQPTIANCQIHEKLRIQVHEIGNNKVKGQRDVITCLFSGKPELEEKQRDAEHFEQLSLSGAPIQSNPLIARPVAARQQVLVGTNYIAVAAAIACIFALMMPTEGDKNSQLPAYLHLSVNMKMVFTYVLGLVTMVILRPS